MTSGLKRLI